MAVGVGAALLAAVAGSCTKKNPDFCDDNADCANGVCDLDLNRCVDDVDGGREADAAAISVDGAPADAAAAVHVSVTTSGTGTGTVTSTPAGINCGSLCDAVFPGGSTVTLNPLEGASSILVEWTGDCTGFAPCELSLDADKTVDASFGIIGEHLWSASYGVDDLDIGTDVVFDRDGNLIVVGLFGGTVDFGGGPLVGEALSQDVFVLKLDPSGEHVWSVRLGGPGNDMPTEVDVDAAGNVVVAGQLDYLSINGFETTPTSEVFVARLSAADGSEIWSKALSVVGGAATLRTVGSDPLGNTVIGGDFVGTFDVDGDQLENLSSNTDIFVVSYDPSGSLLRASSFGDTGTDRLYDLAVDDTSSTFIVGSFETTIHLGLDYADSAGGRDAFVGKFGASGTNVFTKGVGGLQADAAHAVAVDSSGSIFVSGSFGGDVDFGDGVHTPQGNADVFVVSYRPDGTFRWATSFGTVDGFFSDLSSDIAAADRGHVVVSGIVPAPVDFGGGELPADPFTGFVVNLDSATAAHRWSRTILPTGTDVVGQSYGVATDAAGRVALTGIFNGTLDLGGGPFEALGNAYVVIYGP